MDKGEMRDEILEAKEKKGLNWAQIADKIGMSPVWTASACLGNSSATEEQAEGICEALDLSKEVSDALQKYPYKSWDQLVPTDPLVYRFYEVMGVYGEAIKQVIHEEFGDGIMSAIDFKVDVEREEDPKGDRVVVKMNGKFLPYKRW